MRKKEDEKKRERWKEKKWKKEKYGRWKENINKWVKQKQMNKLMKTIEKERKEWLKERRNMKRE